LIVISTRGRATREPCVHVGCRALVEAKEDRQDDVAERVVDAVCAMLVHDRRARAVGRHAERAGVRR
jgi:hypothetical protein